MSTATISNSLRARVGGVTLSGGALISRVFLLDLSMKSLGTNKKAPVALITTDCEPERVKLGKSILQCPELDAIKQHQQHVRRYVETLAIPTGETFRSGMYLLPYSLLTQVEDYLKDAETDMETLVNAFCSVYGQRISDDREALKSLFDEANYPPERKVRASFVMAFEYVNLTTAEGLKEFSQELYERESAKLQAKMVEAAEESRVLIAEQAKKLAAAICERLTPDEDGKPKTFRDSLIGNVNEFLETFSAKNITDDAELEALMSGIKAKLGGITCADIRKSDEVRDDILKHFAEAASQLDGMIVNKPIRRIRLADTDEDDSAETGASHGDN